MAITSNINEYAVLQPTDRIKYKVINSKIQP